MTDITQETNEQNEVIESEETKVQNAPENAEVESGEDKYLESFRKLIQCPTVTDSGHEYFEKFHAVLDEEFPNVAATCEKIDVGGGRDVLLYHWKGKDNSHPVVLMAHQDVVPAGGDDWICDPFSATVIDGKVYGRGTIDCKNTLFSTIKAVDELIEEGFVPEQDVYLSYSDCEENSGPGAELAKAWFIANDVKPGIVVDEGGAIMRKSKKQMVKDAAALGILEKGYADVKFVARGKGGHSSQPPKNTPIARLAALVDYCENHNLFKAKMSPAAKAMIKGLGDVAAPPLNSFAKGIDFWSPLVTHLAPKVVPVVGDAMFKTTMVFTMMEGAIAPNMIPQEAWVNANLRFSPNDNSADCFAKLEKIAKKFDVEMQVVKCREASPMVDLNGEAYNIFANAIRTCYPDVAIVPYMMFGGTDCRTMQEICPTAIRCTPCKLSAEQLDGMHASNENIDISSLGETVNFFKTFLKAYK